MVSTIILILQVACLVFVVIAIMSVLRTMRGMNEIAKITGEGFKIIEEGLWVYMKAMKVEMEARFKKIEDSIASLQKDGNGLKND